MSPPPPRSSRSCHAKCTRARITSPKTKERTAVSSARSSEEKSLFSPVDQRGAILALSRHPLPSPPGRLTPPPPNHCPGIDRVHSMCSRALCQYRDIAWRRNRLLPCLPHQLVLAPLGIRRLLVQPPMKLSPLPSHPNPSSKPHAHPPPITKRYTSLSSSLMDLRLSSFFSAR